MVQGFVDTKNVQHLYLIILIEVEIELESIDKKNIYQCEKKSSTKCDIYSLSII